VARNPDWAKRIVDAMTMRALRILRSRDLGAPEQERQLRECIRECIRQTVKATSGEMQGLIQEQMEQQVPQHTTERVAQTLGIPLSTFRLYIAQKRITTPEKTANTFLWSEEQIRRTRDEIARLRATIRRGRPPGKERASSASAP